MSTRECPIIFSGPMVTAILRGEKTQTRRVVKGQALEWLAPDMFTPEYVAHPENGLCPYGRPGDRLYVKEAWRTGEGLDDLSPREIAERCQDAGWDKPWAPLRYEADGRELDVSWHDFGQPGRLRSPIHMPRWASRLTLEIVSVRVERLQAITEDGTDAEVFGGDYPHTVRPDLFPDFEAAGALSMPECFARVWDDVNGKKPGRAWADNPWVWVIEFTRVTP